MSRNNDFYDLPDNIISLVSAILNLAAKDFKKGHSRRDEVIDFVNSEWFIDICDGLGVNSEEVKKIICNQEND